jgi:chemotaxis protein methyltransferase CheR
MALRPDHFAFVSQMLRNEAAIVLDPGKEYLVESRLLPIVREDKHADLEALINTAMQSPVGSALRYKIVDALTTNETLFYRDFHPFEALRTEILPHVIKENAATRKLSIWSAAASTGQEAYSIAMLLREHFPQLATWKVRLFGTDLSTTTLDAARAGRYTQMEVNRGLPATLLVKYFTKDEGGWRIKDDIRKMVEFQPMNLIQPWPDLGTFDVVFIRNVLIYFDVATKQKILQRIRKVLHPQGHLFLGTAETTFNIDPSWSPQTIGRSTVFRPWAVESQRKAA